MIKGKVSQLESFGLVDGPGVRYVVFLQGCPMRCKYCHNPETWDMSKAKTEFTPEALFKKAYSYKNYWTKSGRMNGGITVSGGEPLMQIDFVTEFFALCKKKGVHTCLDTSGALFTREEPFFSKFNRLMELTDLVMLDIKQTDSAAHKELTGRDNDNILDMYNYLTEIGKDMWIRRVLVPNITDDEAELTNLYELTKDNPSVKKLEILPYHTLALSKWSDLGLDYPLDGVMTPTKEEVERAEKILHINKD